MIYTILRKTVYKDCVIYIAQFETAFQYLFIFNNEIYQQHVFLTPRLMPRILWWLKFEKFPYSRDEIREGEEAILNAALQSIDLLTDPANKPVNRKNPTGECIWQTRENERTGIPSYYCIEHGKYVEWKDGEKPKHK